MESNIYQKNSGQGKVFGVVRARFNYEFTQGLLDNCLKTLKEAGVMEKDIEVVEVPGSVELAYALDQLARHNRFHALIALGAIIKGATPHFDYISKSVMDGIRELTLKHNLPIIAGVITCLNREQAIERSVPGPLNRGVEAAEVALEMAALKEKRGW